MGTKWNSGTLIDPSRNAAPESVLFLIKESDRTSGLMGGVLAREELGINAIGLEARRDLDLVDLPAGIMPIAAKA